MPGDRKKNKYDQYENVKGNGQCLKIPPPSADDVICKRFHEEMKELKYFLVPTFFSHISYFSLERVSMKTR